MVTNTIVLIDKEAAKQAVLTAPTEQYGLVALYKMVYPEWDDIERIDGHPVCNVYTWKIICSWFQELTGRLNKDRAYDKQVMPGGAWMNTGFSGQRDSAVPLKDWEVQRASFAMKEVVS